MRTLIHIFKISTLLLLMTNCSSKQQSIIADGAKLHQVSGEFIFTEGPACDKTGNIYFTDQPNNRIMKWSIKGEISVFMEDCGRSNGLYFKNESMLMACADENNQLWEINIETHEVKVLIAQVENKNLNGPNDLWIDSKGGIYFTDPNYKRDYWEDSIKRVESENVYYFSPEQNSIVVVENQMVKPNGIIGSLDGKTLFVADIGDDKTYKYHIEEDGSLSNRSLFCKMGSDGMTIDNFGNVYLTNNGVFVFNSNGDQIEHIKIDEKWTANVTFGGVERKTLFITAMNSVYTLDMNVKGIR